MGDFEVVKFTLDCQDDEKSAIQSVARQSFSSPIHMTAYGGNFDVLRLLVEKGAKLLAVNRAGDCLLHISIRVANADFSKKVVALCQSLRLPECALDIENVQEKLTPYMLAVLRE